jgi:hypothetical protein
MQMRSHVTATIASSVVGVAAAVQSGLLRPCVLLGNVLLGDVPLGSVFLVGMSRHEGMPRA